MTNTRETLELSPLAKKVLNLDKLRALMLKEKAEFEDELKKVRTDLTTINHARELKLATLGGKHVIG